MSKRLEAHHDNRIYYFTVLDRKPNEITVELYKTTYIFVQQNDEWINSTLNRMQMAKELIPVIITAIA